MDPRSRRILSCFLECADEFAWKKIPHFYWALLEFHFCKIFMQMHFNPGIFYFYFFVMDSLDEMWKTEKILCFYKIMIDHVRT